MKIYHEQLERYNNPQPRGHEITGYSAEGHVSHVLTSRIEQSFGLVKKVQHGKIQCIRMEWWNIYVLLMYQKYKEYQEERDLSVAIDKITDDTGRALVNNLSLNITITVLDEFIENWRWKEPLTLENSPYPLLKQE